MTIDASPVMVTVTRSFRVRLLEGQTVGEQAEAVRAELDELSRGGAILNSTVSSDASRGVVEIELTVEARDLDDGIARSTCSVRSAIHAVLDAMPARPAHDDVVELIPETMHAELVEAARPR